MAELKQMSEDDIQGIVSDAVGDANAICAVGSP